MLLKLPVTNVAAAESAAIKLPTKPFSPSQELRSIAGHHAAAVAIANQSTRADIETESIRVNQEGRTWWDTRLMTDPSQHCAEVIQMHTDAIRYAVTYGGAAVHPQQPYLLTFEA